MEKGKFTFTPQPQRWHWRTIVWIAAAAGIVGLVGFGKLPTPAQRWAFRGDAQVQASPYGAFPQEDDPFQFIPCTDASRPPPLEDSTPQQSWAALFDPNPSHWNWGSTGRGIYLCGYLDLPLDYHNSSDTRIVRIAVTKFQVAGLAHRNDPGISPKSYKSERTIIINPGGPGGSGTSFLWETAEEMTNRFSDGQLDVLGWDPRGVNFSLPAAACFPQDKFRDRWSLLALRYREEAPKAQLEAADAMNNATFFACQQRLGDFGRFVTTASVARDLDEIRKALQEEEVTGYLVSYGTGIGQTYVNMFPTRAGRVILDGTEYVRDHRLLGGFGWTALDNATDAWRDGFLGECINAGPKLCALANPVSSQAGPVTLAQLETRMTQLFESLKARPRSAYTELAGPSLVTYSALVNRLLYRAMYRPEEWPGTAQMLYELEAGNATLAANSLDLSWSDYSEKPSYPYVPSSSELELLVICSDSYDAPLPDGLGWWEQLWEKMSAQSWMAGNSRFFAVLPCRHYNTYWDRPSEVYRGDLNNTLKTPALLIASPYDPATPLRNGRRLLAEMGQNARLIVNHAYGHSSRRDRSDCTDRVAKAYILNGTLPEEQEIQCYANDTPYVRGLVGDE
ncbi:Peptidase S33 tripeptidyl aminopeptidase-like, C-terminal [Penicillium expansum]|uniref:Peptidase S33 tripeptidyl aminopeptidase-like, C-terminal n=1 Tax=Penicillium expansum TaxID=27334 RepID=A0A0A2I8C7_PENEN|nr:Peptidase S33 tripeptidyl aminopeptidase-like, C-terminal [Penicillium expansum]KGO38636.1 Peptidase S33 tripeptidyl aminopeptidase-like, C-terminal [Penicillium expansum]KGO59460.1 Peptidase S33 tripeptidyl aminopeptidase-like, C-terminal [Penicillium expansum]